MCSVCVSDVEVRGGRDWGLCSGMWYGAFYLGTALLAMINRLLAAISDENPAISYDLPNQRTGVATSSL